MCRPNQIVYKILKCFDIIYLFNLFMKQSGWVSTSFSVSYKRTKSTWTKQWNKTFTWTATVFDAYICSRAFVYVFMYSSAWAFLLVRVFFCARVRVFVFARVFLYPSSCLCTHPRVCICRYVLEQANYYTLLIVLCGWYGLA